MDLTTFSDDSVVAETRDFLCFLIDMDTTGGHELAERFGVRGPGTLLFLEPDGVVRDILRGYKGPRLFATELRRVRRNEGTLPTLRRLIEEQPGDLDARYRLALKLRDLKDFVGYEAQLAEILRRDPERRSLALRKHDLEAAIKHFRVTLDEVPLSRMLSEEEDPELLFRGWQAIWETKSWLEERTRDPDKSQRLQREALEAAGKAWVQVPVAETASFGEPDEVRRAGQLLGEYLFDRRAKLSQAQLSFAVTVTRKMAEAAPWEPESLDLLARILVHSGERAEALDLARRCVELDPDNRLWKQRVEELRAP